MTNIDPHGLLREVAAIINRADAADRDLTPVEDAWSGVLLDISEAQVGVWPPSRPPIAFEYSDEELDLMISILRLKCHRYCGFLPPPAPADVSAHSPNECVPVLPDRARSEVDFWTMSAS